MSRRGEVFEKEGMKKTEGQALLFFAVYVVGGCLCCTVFGGFKMVARLQDSICVVAHSAFFARSSAEIG